MIYDMLEKKFQNNYVRDKIVVLISFGILTVIFGCLSLFIHIQVLYILSITFLFLTLISIYSTIFEIKYYGKKISIESNCIKVFNFRGKFLYSYDLSNKKVVEKIVKFRLYMTDNHNEMCLIFYNEFDVHQKIIFHENRNNKDVLIIQNPEFIEMWKELNKSKC